MERTTRCSYGTTTLKTKFTMSRNAELVITNMNVDMRNTDVMRTSRMTHDMCTMVSAWRTQREDDDDVQGGRASLDRGLARDAM